MRRLSARELAQALADRLDRVVPPGFTVRVQGSGLAVLHDGQVVGVSGVLADLDVEAEPRENVASAVWSSLSGVQDSIADTTTEPWPGTGSYQPNPDARVTSDAVLMWFGPEDAPVLRLPPIDLTAP